MIYINNGKRIYYTDKGKGIPVVLLHGYLETSGSWNGFSENLSEFFRVITIDLPGHGSSDLTDETQSMEMMAALIKDLTDDLGTGRIFLVGHSLGGYITLAFLEKFPELLLGYCLFHSHPFADTETAREKRKREITLAQEGKKDMFYRENVKRMFAGINTERSGEDINRALTIASGIKADGIIAVLKGMMQRPSRLFFVEQGGIPFLWILGALDNYIDCNTVSSQVSLPGNAKLVILQNSGHMGFVEEKELSVAVVSDFINGLPVPLP